MQNLDPLSLRLFVAVVQRGSIAAAAQQHHIAAAAVSKRLSELEGVLRTPLLKRTNKGVEPTAAGQALLGHAHRLLRDLDEIFADMREWSGGVRGQVRVCANVSAITQFLPQAIAGFLARYPQAQVHLEERISSAAAKAVRDNEADLGIGVFAAVPPDLALHPYCNDDLALIVPRCHALAAVDRIDFEDTLASDWVGLHTGSVINELLRQASATAGRTLRLRIQVTGYDALSRMVQAGLGIGAMPARVAREYARSLEIAVVALRDAWSRRTLSICVRADQPLAPTARLLFDHLLATRPAGDAPAAAG